MPRPVVIEDLPAYARTGPTLITISLSDLAVSGKVMAAVAALVSAVEMTPGVSITQAYGTITVTKDKSMEEVTAAITQAQKEWDENETTLHAWLDDGVPATTKSYVISSRLFWAKNNGYDEDTTAPLRDALRAAKLREAQEV